MRVEPFDLSRHDRTGFDCGRPQANAWLARSAGQAQARHRSSRTFVLTEDGAEVLGFYALAAHSIMLAQSPADLARGQLASHPIPCVKIVWLAVSLGRQGEGLGERLLADAVRRSAVVALDIGVALLAVDALDNRAASFYERFGFVVWPAGSRTLFARLKDVKKTMGL
jgi:GNAT superfamily N-acetyltransferase